MHASIQDQTAPRFRFGKGKYKKNLATYAEATRETTLKAFLLSWFRVESQIHTQAQRVRGTVCTFQMRSSFAAY